MVEKSAVILTLIISNSQLFITLDHQGDEEKSSENKI